MRSIRIDPTISTSGNVLSGGEGNKSNRLAVGSSLLRLAKLKQGNNGIDGDAIINNNNIDVALSSYPGLDPPTDQEWTAEFQRAIQRISSAPSGETAPLFTAKFASIPSTSRLSEWIASKWAPAILRSYDIAGIRVGARPVYAVRTSDDTVELIWQDLVDFKPVTCGKMVISVGEKGMEARRGGGDVEGGFGAVSGRPLPGEDILVRRLADAASQAVEKGLAVKVRKTKKDGL